MKKSLLAVAAMTAFTGAAQAQSSVTVYGNLDIGVAQDTNVNKTSTTTITDRSGRTTGAGIGGLSTSLFGLRGSEDLGGGLKANFLLEYGLGDVGNGANGNGAPSATNAETTSSANNGTYNSTTGTNTGGFGARYSYVGLQSNNLGEVRLGRQQQSVHSVITSGSAGGANNVAGTIYSSGSNTLVNSATVRPHAVYINRAITYISPNIAGVVVEVQTMSQAKTVDTSSSVAITSVSETGASLKYSGVKNLSLMYAISKQDFNGDGSSNSTNYAYSTGDTKTQVQAATATYDFGVLKAFLLRTENSTKNAAGVTSAKTTNNELGLSAPLTPAVSVFASGFQGKRSADVPTTAVATGNADTNGYQFGAVYGLSKRTSLYAIYGTQNIKGTGTTNNEIKTTGAAAGVRHTF
jgi:predicted porin